MNVLSGNVPDIVGLSETWLKTETLTEPVNISSYDMCRSYRPTPVRAGGLALFISKSIKYKVVFYMIFSFFTMHIDIFLVS